VVTIADTVAKYLKISSKGKGNPPWETMNEERIEFSVHPDSNHMINAVCKHIISEENFDR
jgi:hypothetical protein